MTWDESGGPSGACVDSGSSSAYRNMRSRAENALSELKEYHKEFYKFLELEDINFDVLEHNLTKLRLPAVCKRFEKNYKMLVQAAELAERFNDYVDAVLVSSAPY